MRSKSRKSASTAIQSQASSLSYTLTQFQQWVEKKTHMAILMVLLGLGSSFWLTIEVITPQYASAQETGREVPQTQAYTDRVDISLDRQPNETYETLLRRAEAAAKNAAQASFDMNDRTTDVSVMIVAQNQGSIVPVLSLEVTRSQWLSRPDVQSGTTYFTSARVLLQLEDIATTAPAQPATNPAARPGQPPNGTSSQRGTNPATRSGQPTNATPGRAAPINPNTLGQPTNVTPGRAAPINPNTLGQPTNVTPGRAAPINPNTLGQPTNVTPNQPSPDPNIPTPSQQTPLPGTGLSPQPSTPASVTPAGTPQTPLPGTVSPQPSTPASVGTPMTPTIPNASSSPANSLPTFGPQNPSTAPSNNGTNNTPSTPNSNVSPGI